ncbi:hypothetical protein DERF_011585 [Dermatophagoides farinae]|uniref:Uncharacterized protein n=1 Tax=Dermatophagoides farinae TaxID=6954 RepID=A0A922L0M3_DERFA|nr:hypothetical protein DERF_011585 [Dermatophagoides farinae]
MSFTNEFMIDMAFDEIPIEKDSLRRRCFFFLSVARTDFCALPDFLTALPVLGGAIVADSLWKFKLLIAKTKQTE